MTDPSHAPSPKFVVGAGRMLVFDPSDEQSASGEIKDASIHVDGSNRYAVLEQLAGLLDKQTAWRSRLCRRRTEPLLLPFESFWRPLTL
jgi:hypothetical protein